MSDFFGGGLIAVYTEILLIRQIHSKDAGYDSNNCNAEGGCCDQKLKLQIKEVCQFCGSASICMSSATPLSFGSLTFP